MKTLGTGLGALILTALGALVFLNWSAMAAPLSIDLLFFAVQAPVGFVLLGLAAVLLLLFVIYYVSHQYGAMRETKKLMVEMQRVQALADRAEASRIDRLQQQLTAEFQSLRDSLAGEHGAAQRASRPMAPGPHL